MPENHQITLKNLKLVKHAPAPWKLKGEGIILIYKFSRKWVEQHGILPEHLKGKFKGGLGYVMLVNYHTSPVGPYKELLFIPGKFTSYRKQAITKIYVNTEVSTQNGHVNWGIPKETLPISWENQDGKEVIQVKDGEKTVFSCEIKAGGISFPLSTSLLPIELHQHWDGVDFFTKPSGSGWGKRATIKNLQIDSAFFPNIATQKPLFAVKIEPFRIQFPEATYAI
ncbi:acetoacetate decarboxylase family protein [uncultured Algoriphagus sp.]|uniref:acetoacetate decarboxylase family protein n=1 Tax=uncultured Algoriphagus sp. TaxID=417365 RepID=UPI0030ECA249|tara:strand:- start:21525 stop:22199 length:675 start_codon:yes stop_codon:yes gene_type:complete